MQNADLTKKVEHYKSKIYKNFWKHGKKYKNGWYWNPKIKVSQI